MPNIVGCVCRRRVVAHLTLVPLTRPGYYHSDTAWRRLPRPVFGHHTRRTIRSFSSHTIQHRDTDSAARIINDKDGAEKKRNDVSAPEAKEAAPPPKGKVGIVFTDIVKSTELWEENTKAMAKGMRIHDDVVRELTQIHRGYEVKQNGDGFMIAFSTAISALQFCLAVQQQLLEQEWPESLSKLRAGMEKTDNDGNVLFRGLRLRMSAHWGEPVCVWNDVIHRMDYLGPAVNRAARFIQATEGGQIVVSEEFLLEIQRSTGKGVNSVDTGSSNTTATTTTTTGDAAINNPEASDDHHHARTDTDTDIESNNSDKPDMNHRPRPVLDLQDLHCPQQDQEIISTGTENNNEKQQQRQQRFEVKLLGSHQFKGLSEPQRLYFIIPESLHGRLDLWPKHRHIAGSKGNIIP